MNKIHFEFNEIGFLFSLLVLGLALLLRWRHRKNESSPSVFYSDVNVLESVEKSWRIKLLFLPYLLKRLTLILFLIALCNPLFFLPKKEDDNKLSKAKESPESSKKQEDVDLPTEGLAIYFVLDQSGSMQEEAHPLEGFGNKKKLSRLDALKYLTSQFIQGNPKLGFDGCQDDLIGLVSFARVPKILCPLTLDHNQIQQELKSLTTVQTPEEDGTAIGYAVYKTAHTIAAVEYYSKELLGEDKPAYDINSSIIILVTDGFQNTNIIDENHSLRGMDIKDAALFAKEKGIKLYIVNVEPLMGHPQYTAACQSLKDAAKQTGGEFFLVDSAQHLHKIYRVINEIERTKKLDTKKHKIIVEEKPQILPVQLQFDKFNTVPHLIITGMLILLCALVLETTMLRRIP